MMAREPGYRRQSDAQLNASALAGRAAPYRDLHDASVLVAYSGPRVVGRRQQPLRSLARQVTRDFQMEAPTRLHDHDQDGVVGLRFSAEFAAYLDASPTAIDVRDASSDRSPEAVIEGYYRWPNRATLYLMEHSPSQRLARLGAIVTSIVSGGDPTAAATAYGAHPDDADHTARRALETFVGRRSSLKLRLPRRVAQPG